MKNWLSKNLNTVIIGSFLIPILLVAFVSISHVITFYELANPITWATYLSIAVEIAALAALAGVSAKFGKFIYIPFGIVTFIQLLGNFFFSYSWIDVNSEPFKDWMEMISPMLEPLGVDIENPASHRRILAFFTGGLLPFISLTFAHMLIVYSNKIKEGDVNQEKSEEVEEPQEVVSEKKQEVEKPQEVVSEEKQEVNEPQEVENYEPYKPSNEDLKDLQELFEKYYGLNKQTDNSQKEVKTETIEVTPTPTPDPIYFVDDEPVIEEQVNKPQVNRLVYKKDE
jgi:hypothetical protein